MAIARREFLKVMGSGVCAAAGLRVTAAEGPAGGRPPNIVLCMADDQGWGDMAFNGHPLLKTPQFDAMAGEALRLDRFYAAAPVCSPTRGSVMTGRHPNRFGCFSWGYPIRPQEITVAEALKTAGYVTGHFGKWHLGSVQQGSPVTPGTCGFDEWFSAPNFFDNDPILSRQGKAVQTAGESSMVTVDAALEFIRRHAGGPQPFLAVVWFGSPHAPHQALPEDRALYADQPAKRQHFLGEITAMDRAFGKLRGELRALGLRDDTILWYCSDNGGLPGVGSTGGRGNKGQLYDGGLRVPALLEWPARITAPRTCAVPCNTTDIYPTLLEIAGVHMPGQPPLDGVSLLPLIAGTMASRPQPMGFWAYPAPGIITPTAQWMKELFDAQAAGREPEDRARLFLDAGDLSRQYPEDAFQGHAAWLDWPWKLHRIRGKDGALKRELYNLEADPAEKQDLSGQETARTNAMDARLGEWLASVVRSLNGRDYGA